MKVQELVLGHVVDNLCPHILPLPFAFDKELGDICLERLLGSSPLSTELGWIYSLLIIGKCLKPCALFLQIIFIEIATASSPFCCFPSPGSPRSGICLLFTEPSPQSVSCSD